MTATVQSITNPGNCNHRTVTFDVGALRVQLEDIQNARPEGFEELRDAALLILRHQYLSRRAAGRTAAQAMNDLTGFVVRV